MDLYTSISTERLEELGYLTLPATGIDIHLGPNYFRDDGEVDSLFDHFVEVRMQFGFSREEAITLTKKGRSSKNGFGGHILCYTLGDLSLELLTKGVKLCKINPVLGLYIEGHEEGHVAEHLDQLDPVADWFRSKGFPNIDPYELRARGDEYISSAVGLVLLVSRGHFAVPMGWGSSSRMEESQIFMEFMNGASK